MSENYKFEDAQDGHWYMSVGGKFIGLVSLGAKGPEDWHERRILLTSELDKAFRAAISRGEIPQGASGEEIPTRPGQDAGLTNRQDAGADGGTPPSPEAPAHEERL